MQKVLVICGPTCVGKTDISIDLAHQLNGEIINGDSMQVYKEMNIGTAKITKKEMSDIPHHLFDIKTIKESFSVSEYQKLVREKINEICSKGKLPIIVGGTGLYLKAALYDYEFTEEEKINYNLEQRTNEDLYAELLEKDPKTAKNTHINNKKRIIRALEILYKNGLGKEDLNKTQEHEPIYNVFYLGLTKDRESLYKAIEERVDKMAEEGLIDEAKYIFENASQTSTCLQAIGYKEFFDYFKGNYSLDLAIYNIK